jgi:triosephosphate isomerase
MRIPLIAANWKMNTTVNEAIDLVRKFLNAINHVNNVEMVICPPFISLASVMRVIKNSQLKLGAQNMYFEKKGAYTGEVSPYMLTDLCQFVIIGHSERRQYFNETDEIINKKIKTALEFELTPILCIGEKFEENLAGRTEEILSYQLESSLAGIQNLKNMVLAYEPIWAIGTGKFASGMQANENIGFIRQRITDLHNKETSNNLRILYGGSVTAENIIEFIKQPEIDGALVGGASLKADQFINIINKTAEISGSYDYKK